MTPFVRRVSPQGVGDLQMIAEEPNLKVTSSSSSGSSNINNNNHFPNNSNMPTMNENDESYDNYHDDIAPKKKNRLKAWERRRRRFEKLKADEAGGMAPSNVSETASTDSSRKGSQGLWRSSGRSKKQDIDDDIDPYDSDPGESYREHCARAKPSLGTKSCLPVPQFFLKSQSINLREEESDRTAPPSPMTSEMGDGLLGHTPASLPPNNRRVRYSLRSTITDGSEKQSSGPQVMERRDLRPNKIQLNVSHWSDEGGRPYMEDR